MFFVLVLVCVFLVPRTKTGTGSNSQVFSAVERITGRQVAVKAIHTDWLDKRRVEFLRAEIDIHREVSSHPYVVRLLGVFDDPEASYIVQELAPGGSLLEHLHSRERMGTEREVSVRAGFPTEGRKSLMLGAVQ